jgi:hypothetical protein
MPLGLIAGNEKDLLAISRSKSTTPGQNSQDSNLIKETRWHPKVELI